MPNEKAIDVEIRVSKMTDEQICEILVDKENWQESMYKQALVESKKRNITMDALEKRLLSVSQEKEIIAAEPLSKQEKRLFMVLPIGMVHTLLQEKYYSEGHLNKIKEMKVYMMYGKGIWFAAGVISLLGFYVFTRLTEVNY